MATHKFGIMDQFEKGKLYYLYVPEKYNCISVDMHIMDYVVDNYLVEWKKVITYVCTDSKIFYGLDESGITIIPPESLLSFQNIIINANTQKKYSQLTNLIDKVNEAILNNKHLIHFGI